MNIPIHRGAILAGLLVVALAAGADQVEVPGGSWDEDPSNLRSSYRNVKPPVSGRAVYGSIGFRCARSL